MSFESSPQLTNKKEVLSGVEIFKTKEGDTVTLKWNIVRPKILENKASASPNKGAVVLFLPGVALESDSGPVLESAQDFADASQNTTYSISTRIDNPNTKNSQEAQAEAISQFINKQKLNDFTVVGNSQGANKSMDLVAQLEQEGKNVRGLILTNPAGIYEQDPKELTKNFFKDATLETPDTLLKQEIKLDSIKNIGEAIKLGNSVSLGIVKEAVSHPGEVIRRVKRESEEAATVNIHAKDIKTRIVIVLGARDVAFDSNKIIPCTSHGKSLRAQEMRGKELKKLFQNSDGIKVIEATKLSNHGLHYMRGDEVAETSLYMLNRMERREKIKQ